MKVVTAEEMSGIDRKTIEEYGVPGVVLMERAGLAVALRIRELFGKNKNRRENKEGSYRKVIVLAGSGNNGGDGFVVARNLHKAGWDVKVFLTSRPENLKGDALIQYKIAAKSGIVISSVEELLTNCSSLITRHSIFVDALLGTGLSKNVTGMLSEIIGVVNNANVPIVSVDIPSGISSDNGQIMGQAVRADYTVTFGLPKRGHFLYPGAEHTGKLFIEEIGFPDKLLRSGGLNVELLMKERASSLLPLRRRYSNKGDYGHVLVVAGSRGKTGAALMAAKACLRAGAGLVTIGVPESVADIFQSRVTEEMILLLPDAGDGTLSEKAAGTILDFLNEKADVLAIGPGIGVTAEIRRLMKTLVQHSTAPLVIDADGLNSLQGEREFLSKSKAPVIVTPHPGEMARLLSDKPGKTTVKIMDIEKDRINVALSFAKKTSTYIVLKGVPTIVAEPSKRAYVNLTGNPGMATAGAGDILTGIISGFLSQGLKALDASILGVYVHGLAGDIASTEKGTYSLIATDIIDSLPAAFHSLKNNE